MQKNLQNKKKLLLLSCAACIIAASYAILRPFKISLFYQIVGKEYYPLSKFLMIIVAIPAVSIYSKLIDRYKKHVVLSVLFSVYFILCIIFSILFSHPVYGLSNTSPDPYRILGWLYTLAMDFYPTFVVGTFWAFINSTSTHEFAKNSYGYLYAAVKVGSLLATSISFGAIYFSNKNVYTIPSMIAISGILTLFSLVFIITLVRTTPKENLYGHQQKEEKKHENKSHVAGMFEGLKFMIINPYVFGTFLLFYFYDVVYVIIEYQATIKLSVFTEKLSYDMSSMLFLSAFLANSLGLLLALFVTPRILKSIKLKHSLLIMPTITALIVALIFFYPTIIVMVGAMSLLPSINFSVNSPIREIIFIPTIKEIQFKSKAWIDSFGRTISKSSGSAINMLFSHASMPVFMAFNSVFSIAITIVWGAIAYSMGNQCQQVLDKKEVIGEKDPDA